MITIAATPMNTNRCSPMGEVSHGLVGLWVRFSHFGLGGGSS
jgi:hypothetical protein